MKLKQAMERQGLGEKDLAKAMKISLRHAYRLMRSDNLPSRPLAERIYDWLKPNVTLEELEHPKRF